MRQQPFRPAQSAARPACAAWARSCKNRSLSLDYYRDAGMARWVDQTVAAHKIDRVMVFSSPMAQYADQLGDARRVIDFCDVDSDKWRQYAETEVAGP